MTKITEVEVASDPRYELNKKIISQSQEIERLTKQLKELTVKLEQSDTVAAASEEGSNISSKATSITPQKIQAGRLQEKIDEVYDKYCKKSEFKPHDGCKQAIVSVAIYMLVFSIYGMNTKIRSSRDKRSCVRDLFIIVSSRAWNSFKNEIKNAVIKYI